MKQLLTILMVLALAAVARAQPALYGNEWIDYSSTYYKFKTGPEGIYRITKSMLDNAGVPAANGSSFRLFRDGREVPVFVSTNGAFSASDYIEFFAPRLDGSLDSGLYANPRWQPNNRISLFSDSASYFLTISTGTTNARFTQVPNNIPAGATPAPWCWHTVGRYFTKEHVHGRHIVDLQPIFSSLFESGEGFVDTLYGSTLSSNFGIQTPELASSGTSAKLALSIIRFNYATTPADVSFGVFLNGQLLADSLIGQDETQHFLLPINASQVATSNSLQLVPGGTNANLDFYGLSFFELTYPRNFSVSNLPYLRFNLPPGMSNGYLELTGFNSSGFVPRLYDLTNNLWYDGDIAITGKIRFNVSPSSNERSFVVSLVSTPTTPVFQKALTFTNYSLQAAHSDFILISNSNLSSGNINSGVLSDYKNYREQAGNGGHSVLLVDVNELYDQFAYGVAMHPVSIQRFLQFAYYTWITKPQYVFLVGKGVFYPSYRKYLQSPNQYSLTGIVPTYGDPGSDVDFVNFLPGKKQAMAIGRLSAWNAQEVTNYLNKVSAYETAVKENVTPTADQNFWKKKVLHIAGGRFVAEQTGFLQTLGVGAAVIKDTAYGGLVTTIAKNTTVPVDNINSKTVDSLINNGLSMICYHGHASSNGFEFNLNNPDVYNSSPKLPHFIALGCDVAQIFSLTNSRTVSEKYLAASTGGSISMIASNNLQYGSFHNTYLPQIYNSVSKRNYGKTIGIHHQFAYDTIRGGDMTDFTFFHLESMLLEGDPALVVPGALLPDYFLSDASLTTIPGNVTTAIDSFTLRIAAYNLGRATNDSLFIRVEHINPANVSTTIRLFKVGRLYNLDSFYVRIPVNKVSDLGLNKYRVTIDDGNTVAEMSESNNAATLDLFIFADNLVPVYPKEFSIVSQQSITLKASTLNVFRSLGRYLLEIDTTELFNSPLKQATTIVSNGGVIKWTPGIAYQNNTVYYWRAAYDSLQNGQLQWSGSSFIYLSNSSPGWNQSHYYQFRKNNLDSIAYGPGRRFQFQSRITEVTASNAIYSGTGQTPWNTADFIKVMVNGLDVQRLGCPPWGGTLQVMVFDSVTQQLWVNAVNGSAGAYPQCLTNRNIYAFEFPLYTKQGRDNASKFIKDSIPNGHYVLLRNLINADAYDSSFIDTWKLDTTINGPGQSLYHVLYNMGFTSIDSFNRTRPFIFFRKKGNANFPVYQFFGADRQSRIEHTFLLPSSYPRGKLLSTIIGPAKQWNNLKWQTSTLDGRPDNDDVSVIIAGIDTNGNRTDLYIGRVRDTTLSFINASAYPNIQLTWTTLDSTDLTSAQLDYWRVLYSPVPEAALNPAAHFSYRDSTVVGNPITLSVAIENLTPVAMDSMAVRYRLIDANGISRLMGNKRYKRLINEGDTLHAHLVFDPSIYTGANYLFIEANPDKDQPEQYHPNNLGYLPLFVEADERNPLLDVTFDGIHILDRDIVSAKPYIKIGLRDDNKFLALNDTSLLRVSIRYPDDPLTSRRRVPFDGRVCRFIPATLNGHKNEAFIEYRPVFEQDGVYDLFVNGTDRSGNAAGNVDYRVSFEVINRSTITHVLNYPNPFSTSTAFVFTLTGSQIPNQFKIQILTVTGKVVREITRQELGPIHIGRNVTEYKWDGRDQYGQILGNGVYLYRVVTALNGEGIEHRSDMDGKPGNDNVDKFFKNGWGKMYIMR